MCDQPPLPVVIQEKVSKNNTGCATSIIEIRINLIIYHLQLSNDKSQFQFPRIIASFNVLELVGVILAKM
jgi:hypothetical protein